MEPICYLDGAWRTGNVPLMGAMTQAAWLSGVVFDGARAFAGKAPDLDLHCRRVVASALALGLTPTKTAEEIEALAREGIDRFPPKTELYIRPMFWAETGMVLIDPASTRFALVVHPEPMPSEQGFSACLSPYRRPGPEQAPTQAKASCLYPIASMALADARKRGFGNAVMLDPLGHVAELTGANIFLVKDGVVVTPAPNGTFLNGITRQRVIQLLRDDGRSVVERSVQPSELTVADEIFSTGNYAKVMPIIRYEERDLQPGPLYRRARQLYWDYALS